MSVMFDFVHHFALRTKEHFLEHIQDIDGSHDHAESRYACEPWIVDGRRAERAEQNSELTDEAIQARQAHRRERNDEHDTSKDRRDLPQPAINFELTRVSLFVDHANEQEQCTRTETMIDHL